MKIYNNPEPETWKELTTRPQLELGFLESSVRNILNRVKKSGDRAIRELTLQYDQVQVEDLQVSNEEISYAIKAVSPSLKKAIESAARNIETFHRAQHREEQVIETMPGVSCWRKAKPIQKVGIYIPGGSAPLFSTVLMLGIPARIAGCEEIILCSPPGRDGRLHPAILFAAQHVGITRIFKAGGAQAVGALAYGTETIPSVYKIFGPGNQYVMKAKQLVTDEGLAIDMPAGPSEVLILADNSAQPEFIAADLLSQAEHGEDSQVMLVLLDKSLETPIRKALDTQLASLPRKKIAEKALANSHIVFFGNAESALAFVNDYAPEHLIINMKNAEEIADRITNAGSVFLGNYSPEALGDYASGTNHTLPTNGYAKAFAGVSLESFTKQVTYQKISKQGIQHLGPVVETLAEAEELIGHKRAVQIRLENLSRA